MKTMISLILFCITPFAFAEININPSVPRIIQSDTAKKMVHEASPNMQPAFYAKQHDGYKVEDKNGNVFYVDDIKNPTVKVGNHIVNYGYPTSGNENIRMETYIEKICFTMDCQ